MKRLLATMVLFLAMTVSARAHFVFLLPEEGGRKVQVVFSDTPSPDRAELLKKIAHTTFTTRIGGAQFTLKKVTPGKDALDLVVPGDGSRWVLGVCPYGVSTRGKEPVLLSYYAKTCIGLKTPTPAAFFAQTFPEMKLEVIVLPEAKAGPAVKILWEGKPLADADVVLYVPGQDKAVEKKSDKDGLVKLEKAAKAGLYGVRAAHTIKKKGKLGDKEYAVMRSYSTLTFPANGDKVGQGASDARFLVKYLAEKEEKKPEANPEATKLLADARAERANWVDFPGFRADVTVNVEGKLVKGTVDVTKKGKVHLKLDGEQPWAQGMLSSIVGHRLDDTTTLTTPCRFADDVTDHPLGRAIKVLNDEFHSSYRIRDKQVIEVNRRMGDVRFTITVMENRLNAEKKYLPSTYVVNYWDVKTGALKKSVTHYNTFVRVGKFDLPRTVLVVTAEDGKQVTRSLTLSGYVLNK